MKPKPLDLEEDEIQKRVKEILKNREDYKYLYDIFENFLQKSKSNLNNGFVLFPNQEEQISIDILALFELSVKETIKEITQRLKSALQGLDDDIDFLYRKFEKYDVWSKSNDEVCDMCEKYFKKQVKKWFPDVMER